MRCFSKFEPPSGDGTLKGPNTFFEAIQAKAGAEFSWPFRVVAGPFSHPLEASDSAARRASSYRPKLWSALLARDIFG